MQGWALGARPGRPACRVQQHSPDGCMSGWRPLFLARPCTELCPVPGQIQQAAERLERNFVDSRQLKVCATCFDLSVSLLRVLEMTVTLAPEIFLDWSRPSSELLLRRLAQVHPHAGSRWSRREHPLLRAFPGAPIKTTNPGDPASMSQADAPASSYCGRNLADSWCCQALLCG